MQTVPYILGIAHPTGFPVFVLFGWLFSHLIPVGSVAMRMALMCALAMSAAALITARIVAERTGSAWLGTACAWLFAFGQIAWTRGTRTEIHALATLFVALTLFCALHWYKTRDSRYLIAGALAFGLGIGTHPVVALLGPGLFVLLIARWQTLDLRAVGIALAVFALGCSLYAYLPIRGAQISAARLDPTLALGVAPGRPFWNYDLPETRSGFLKLVSGSDFDVNGGLRSIFSPRMYFVKGPAYIATAITEFTPIGAVLILVGIFALFRDDWQLALGFTIAGFLAVPFALGYPPEADIQRYFLSSFVVCAAFVGIGVDWLANGVPSSFARPARIAIVMALALFAVVTQAGTFHQRNDLGAQRLIASVSHRTPNDAILIAPWIYATPLAYAAYVEHSLGGRTLDAAWLQDDAALVPYWKRSRPVYVIGIVFGSVPGYSLKPVGGNPTIYAVVKQ